MKLSYLIFALSLLFIVSCGNDESVPERKFYMGFTPFPWDISLEAVNQTYDNILRYGDIVNHHFDNGVPWVEADNGLPFSDNIMNDFNFRKTNTPAEKKVIVSVAALNGDRNGMARYRGTSDAMDLPSPWDTYTFADTKVRVAYLNYCKRVIDFFEPDYFNMNVEANLFHFIKPESWEGFLGFHEYVYNELKAAYPNLTIFCSITGAHILEGYFPGKDVNKEKNAALALLEDSDLYAISFYPYMSSYLCNPYPPDSFTKLFALSSLPIAIAETGYPAQSFEIKIDGVPVTMEGDANKQKDFFTDMLNACSKRETAFVISFTFRDYDQLWADLGSVDDISTAWRDTGFLDENGTARPALEVWKNFFERPYSN